MSSIGSFCGYVTPWFILLLLPLRKEQAAYNAQLQLGHGHPRLSHQRMGQKAGGLPQAYQLRLLCLLCLLSKQRQPAQMRTSCLASSMACRWAGCSYTANIHPSSVFAVIYCTRLERSRLKRAFHSPQRTPPDLSLLNKPSYFLLQECDHSNEVVDAELVLRVVGEIKQISGNSGVGSPEVYFIA